MTLTWNAPATATTYQVMRSTTSGSSYTLLQNVGVTTFTDTTVVTGTTYYYVVAASNGFCSSADSPQVTVTPSCVPPSAPTVTATPSNNQVTLSWAAPSGAISYVVYRGTTSGGESSTAVSTPTTTNYVDTNVSNNSTYYYVVAASNGSCASSNSVEVSATPVCTPPSAPGALTATPGDAQVSLSWVATTSWGWRHQHLLDFAQDGLGGYLCGHRRRPGRHQLHRQHRPHQQHDLLLQGERQQRLVRLGLRCRGSSDAGCSVLPGGAGHADHDHDDRHAGQAHLDGGQPGPRERLQYRPQHE